MQRSDWIEGTHLLGQGFAIEFLRFPARAPSLTYIEIVTRKMATVVAAADSTSGDDALYPIAVLIDELRNDDVQVG